MNLGHRGPDVWIRVRTTSSVPGNNSYRCSRDLFSLSVAGIAQYTVRGGSEIMVERWAHARRDAVRLFLLGSALGALWHQRGIFPLHGSVVAIRGVAVAFIGPSGAGKSTLAAMLVQRGHSLLADDVCPLFPAEDGILRAFPVFPRLRLRREALEALGRDVPRRLPIGTPSGKYSVAIVGSPEDIALPVQRIYLLHDTEVRRPIVRRVQGLEALRIVADNVYRPQFAASMGMANDVFRRSASVVSAAEVFRLHRTMKFSESEAVLEFLDLHSSTLDDALAVSAA
jgi:hypothetical protein